MKETDRDNEVNRILGAFKLNPFEQLGLMFDASLEDARRQYRKVSLLVHPDKCNHPLAKDAFEVLGAANKSLLDEEKSNHLRYALNYARGAHRLDNAPVLHHVRLRHVRYAVIFGSGAPHIGHMCAEVVRLTSVKCATSTTCALHSHRCQLVWQMSSSVTEQEGGS